MPQAIDRVVRRGNVKFMHEKSQFSVEYFTFMKKLVVCNQFVINKAIQDNKVVSIVIISYLFCPVKLFLNIFMF